MVDLKPTQDTATTNCQPLKCTSLALALLTPGATLFPDLSQPEGGFERHHSPKVIDSHGRSIDAVVNDSQARRYAEFRGTVAAGVLECRAVPAANHGRRRMSRTLGREMPVMKQAVPRANGREDAFEPKWLRYVLIKCGDIVLTKQKTDTAHTDSRPLQLQHGNEEAEASTRKEHKTKQRRF